MSQVKTGRSSAKVYRTLKGLEVVGGKLLFGNTSGLRDNVRGAYTIRRSRAASDASARSPIGQEVRRNGFVRLADTYERALIEHIKTEFDAAIEDPARSQVRAEHNGVVYSRYLPESYKEIPAVRHLLSPIVTEAIEAYYGSYFDVALAYAWRNRHVPPEVAQNLEVYSERWHCDSQVSDRIKYFVFLTEVTESDGPLALQPRPRTASVLRSTLPSAPFDKRGTFGLPVEKMEDRRHVTLCTGPPGTGYLAVTGKCFHRASIPAAGRIRDVIQFQFVPASRPLQDNWYETPRMGRHT